MMNKSFIQARVTFYENLIAVYEAALLAFDNPTLEQYTLNTGQTTQTVKRRDIQMLIDKLDGIYNQHSIWCNRLNGGNTTIMRPGW